MWVVAGTTSGSDLGDVWGLDLDDSSWSELDPTGCACPSARSGHVVGSTASSIASSCTAACDRRPARPRAMRGRSPTARAAVGRARDVGSRDSQRCRVRWAAQRRIEPVGHLDPPDRRPSPVGARRHGARTSTGSMGRRGDLRPDTPTVRRVRWAIRAGLLGDAVRRRVGAVARRDARVGRARTRRCWPVATTEPGGGDAPDRRRRRAAGERRPLRRRPPRRRLAAVTGPRRRRGSSWRRIAAASQTRHRVVIRRARSGTDAPIDWSCGSVATATSSSTTSASSTSISEPGIVSPSPLPFKADDDRFGARPGG